MAKRGSHGTACKAGHTLQSTKGRRLAIYYTQLPVWILAGVIASLFHHPRKIKKHLAAGVQPLVLRMGRADLHRAVITVHCH